MTTVFRILQSFLGRFFTEITRERKIASNFLALGPSFFQELGMDVVESRSFAIFQVVKRGPLPLERWTSSCVAVTENNCA